MSSRKYSWRVAALLALIVVWLCGMTAFAEGASGDNSLSSLGITTEGAVVSPEFYYSTIEYNVTVPAGTSQLSLDPVTSNGNAWIVDISGTELVDGEATVVITVSAENGSQCSYYLYVKADESAGTVTPAETEPQTETETEPQTETEPETEDPRYVKVDRNSLQEAENTIATLKSEAGSYRDRLDLLMKILYGMIGFCVVLLFVVINLLLKKRDLKSELRNYKGYGYPQEMGSADAAYGQAEDAYASQEPSGKKKKESRKKAKKGAAPEEAYRQDDYAPQGYADNGYTTADSNGYYGYAGDPANDAPQDFGSGYDMPAAEEPFDDDWQEPVPEPVKDDPATVPKPSRAKKKAKKIPEYEKPQQDCTYQPQQKQTSDNVEIDMIDL